MKISYNWLKDYLNIDKSPEEVSDILTAIGLEVEGLVKFETVKGGLENFVIGHVKECTKHPNADRLSVTKVDAGTGELLPIVCGAPNVAEGQKVVVALPGAVIHMGEQSFTIKKTKIRGEISQGMICAEDELGLGDSHEGIMVLEDDIPVGMKASDYFRIETDTIFEIGLTPNRIDAGSHYGVARDLAAFFSLERETRAKLPDISSFKPDNNDYPVEVIIENKEACPRYAGVTITGVQVTPSPSWIQDKLRAIGLKPINNVVDITNLVLHETGQPLHGFDADKIAGKKIIVKTLPAGTKLKTLDEEERELDEQDLIICNVEEGMAIAGVFGGVDSGVTTDTKNVFLESAYFNPVWVRKTARRHGLHTDASFRFERGADPGMTIYALKRAALLIKETAGGKISSDVVDNYPAPVEDSRFQVSISNIQKLAGNPIKPSIIKNILSSLEIKIEKDEGDTLSLLVPAYRVDVTREADIVEDILRIYGYNNITFTEEVRASLNYAPRPGKDKIVNHVSDFLSSNGFHEIMSNSLTKSAYYDYLDGKAKNTLVELVNPLSTDLNVMRQTLLFGGLEAILRNINRQVNDLKLYEFGNCYYYDGQEDQKHDLSNYREVFRLGVFMTGNLYPETWNAKPIRVDIYHLKGYIEQIFEMLGIQKKELKTDSFMDAILEEGIGFYYNNVDLAVAGHVKKEFLLQMGIEQPVFFSEFNFNNVLKFAGKKRILFAELPKYPEVRRDLSLLLDKNVKFETLKNLAYETAGDILKEVNLFDVYTGDKIDKNKKSYAISYKLQDVTKTLKDQEIDNIMKKIIDVYSKKLGASIR
ncbi:MAG: phenylalanine--tRNA ligase subunit beta [Bacteroidota bacterium]